MSRFEQTPSPSRPVAAVIGSQRADERTLAHARTLGEALIDRGFRVVTGGLGGVMRAVCEGARQSALYQEGDTIGILPTYTRQDANPFVDIVICTGLNHARNTIVVASADVVIAVGGRAGTLNEISMAWTLGRPIVALDVPGWGEQLTGVTIDDRREDTIHGPFPPREAAARALELIRDISSHHRREFGETP